VQLDTQQYREHGKWIWDHYKAELAHEKFLLPEDIWEVWKTVFDYPGPMTQTEQGLVDDWIAGQQFLGDEFDADDIHCYLRVTRGTKLEEPSLVEVDKLLEVYQAIVDEPQPIVVEESEPIDEPEPIVVDEPEPVVFKKPEPTIWKKPEPIIFVAPPNEEEQAKLDRINERNARCNLPLMTEEHIKCQLLFMRAKTDEEKAEAYHQINMIPPLLALKKVARLAARPAFQETVNRKRP